MFRAYCTFRFNALLSLSLTISLLCSACSNAANGPDNPAFEFRAIASPTNASPTEYGIAGTQSVDNDWSLWGHNLSKVLKSTYPAMVYSSMERTDGRLDSTQYCFSSEKLYNDLAYWIDDQWGRQGGRFTIMPADNKKVCLCDECRKKGNTIDNATPAVAALVERIARKYPRHTFFMTAYHTTKAAPTKTLPKNVGVMLSAVDIPLRYVFSENKGYKAFDAMLTEWKRVCSTVYVWDYERNFDDYLTPFPCLFAMQERMRYYRQAGIKGIFLNGSGDDYSTFDDMQTYVLAQMMQNPDIDVDATVREFYKRYYPELGGFIADYYMTLEYRAKDTNHILPLYGTMEEMKLSYLDEEAFVDFWQQLDRKSKSIVGEERQRINRMLTAMAFTCLELKPKDEEVIGEMRAILRDYKSVPGLNNYKETNGSLEEYLRKSRVKN